MPTELSEPEMFVLLAKRRRRQLIKILYNSSTPLTAIELARRIGDREYENPSAEELREIHIALYHTHIPRLEESAVVEYDEKMGTVSPGRNFSIPLRFLESVREIDLPWSDE